MDKSSIKDEIGKILNIPVNSAWEIVDSKPDDGLYLIHYTQNADKNIYGNIRGLIVDINKKINVCRSIGYIPHTVKDSIKFNKKNILKIKDNNGATHTLKKKNIAIKRGYEGLMIRIFKYDGKIYISTYKKINIIDTKSRWGSSRTFHELFKEISGNVLEDIFDSNKEYSSNIYVFILSHPDILNVYKGPSEKGKLLFIGNRKIFYNNNIDKSKIDFNIWKPFEISDLSPNGNPEESQSLPCNNANGIVKNLTNLTEDQANHYLRYGAYSRWDDENIDIKLRTGEFIIIYIYNDANSNIGKGWPNKVIRIMSTPYNWRLNYRDNNPNLFYRFIKLTNYIKNNSFISLKDNTGNRVKIVPNGPKHGSVIDMAAFKIQYPFKPIYDLTNYFNNNNDILIWKPELLIGAQPSNDKIFVILNNLMAAVPLNRQKEILEYPTKLENIKKRIIDFIYDIYVNNQENNTDRIDKIISDAKNFLIRNLKDKSVYIENETGKSHLDQSKFDKCIKEGIEFLINNEEGGSLYKLYKIMNNLEKQDSV